MPANAKSAGSKKLTPEQRLEAIAPLLKLARVTEEQVSTRAAEVGISARSLRRWIAAHQGREPGPTKLRFDFPAVALFVMQQDAKGDDAREIHRELSSTWADFHDDRPCPSYQTIRRFLKSLRGKVQP